MKRLNFTLDLDTVALLEELAQKFYDGNKSQTVRAALESLAAHSGHEGWVISGYTPKEVIGGAHCHGCGEAHRDGEVLFRPVFERGQSPQALARIPAEPWLDCPDCVEKFLRS
jgi:hypothetical protein